MNFDRNSKPLSGRNALVRFIAQPHLDAVKPDMDCSRCGGTGQLEDYENNSQKLCKCVTKQVDKILRKSLARC